MEQTILAHFDGKVIVPDEPLDLPAGERLQVRIESASRKRSPFADLLKFGVDLPDAPSDLSEQHDHYLYGTPKV